MAIEFECPSCSTTIRVPDSYSGKRGRCPGCNKALQIPQIPVPQAPQQQSAAVPPIAVPPAATVPVAAPVSAAQPTPAAAPAVSAASPLAGGADMASSAAVPADTIPQINVPQTSPITPAAVTGNRRGRRRRRPSRALVIGMPVAGFLLLLVIIFISVTDNLSGIQGTLTGRLLEQKSLPETLIPWADTGLSEGDRETLKKALTDRPEVLSSEAMACRLIGDNDGIRVKLTAAAGHQWCAVDAVTGGGSSLGLWLRQNRQTLTALRRKEMLAALQQYCSDKIAQTAGEQIVINAVQVRDEVAMNAAVNVLGYAVLGTAGNNSRRPVQEDTQGTLYFCVPRGATSMTINGRTSPTTGLLFAGSYTVQLNPAAETSVPAADEMDVDKMEMQEETAEDTEGMSAEPQMMMQ